MSRRAARECSADSCMIVQHAVWLVGTNANTSTDRETCPSLCAAAVLFSCRCGKFEVCSCVYNESHELGVAWVWSKQLLFISAPVPSLFSAVFVRVRASLFCRCFVELVIKRSCVLSQNCSRKMVISIEGSALKGNAVRWIRLLFKQIIHCFFFCY